ncbi:MAG: iron-sulfur-binding protein [Vicingaceae bacterium]|nr:MAG: iron-sulfur-binding protein [Vicingaceae bacterium]
MIKVTDAARDKFLEIVRQEGKSENAFLRVGVKMGGCSGFTYMLDIDDNISENDKVFEDNGIRIVCDKKSILYLAGTVLDYSGGLKGKGFFFNNPNASRTCGCGESFAV